MLALINTFSPIPKRIIQTGKSRTLPLREQASAASLTCLNPGFDYVYFDDAAVETFIDREFPNYRGVMDRFPHRIQRFDFFRYLAVYRLGGFYFDLDVFLARGINELATLSCVFPFEELTLSRYLRSRHNIDWEIGNYAFGAAPGHPFLRAVIDNCIRAQDEPGWSEPMLRDIPGYFRSGFEVLNTTGPGMLTRTLAENPRLAGQVNVLFPDDVCDERTFHNFGNYGVHLMAASWRSRDGFLKRRLSLLWENRVRRQFKQVSSRHGPRRSVLGTPEVK